MKTHDEITKAIDKFADTVYRICYLHTKNISDCDDIFQNVFFKYMTKSPKFKDDEHEKAWIIRVTINLCKDSFKEFFKKNICSLDNAVNIGTTDKEDLQYVRDAVRNLPINYRNVIFLFYYEGYSAIEISKMLHKNVNTIYTWLNRARNILKNELEGEIIE